MKKNFEFGYQLPDPNSDFPKGFKFLGYKYTSAFEKGKYLNDELVLLLHEINGIALKDLVARYHTKHYTFNWKRPRQVWLQRNKPIFFDFNDGILWRIFFDLEFSQMPFCACYSKKEFIRHYKS